MKIFERAALGLTIVVMVLTAGCESGGNYAGENIPTQRVIVENNDWADMMRANTEMWDTMHLQDMERMESWDKTLDSFSDTSRGAVGRMGRRVKSRTQK